MEQNSKPDTEAKNRDVEEAKEEKKRQKFVAKVYKEEEWDAETAFIPRQVQEELEDAEAENSLPEGERTRRETNRQNMLNEINTNDFLREQRLQSRLAQATNELNQGFSQENGQENGHEEQEGNPVQSDVESE